MFCSNCGAPLDEGQRFCSNCGAPVQVFTQDRKQEPELTPTPAPEATPEAAWNFENEADFAKKSPTEDPVVPPEDPTRKSVAPERPKKKKKGWILIVLAVVLVAAGALAALRWKTVSAFAENFIGKSFSDPVDYYHQVERNNFKAAAGIAEAGMDGGILTDRMADGSYIEEKLQLSFDASVLGDELLDLIEDETGMDVSWFKNAGMYLSVGQEDPLLGGKMTAFLNDKDIIGADFLGDLDNEAIYFSVPRLSEGYARVELQDYAGGLANTEAIQEFAQLLSDGETLPILTERYSELILKNLTNVEKSTEELQAGELSGKYTALTVRIKEKTMLRIAEDVLNKARNDAELQKLAIAYFRCMNMSEEEAYRYYVDSVLETIDRELEQLEDEEPDDGNEIRMVVYVNALGRIVGRDIRVISDGEKLAVLSYKLLTKGTSFALDAEFSSDRGYSGYTAETRITLRGDGSLSLKGEIDGSFDLYVKALSGWNGNIDGFDGKAARLNFHGSYQNKTLRFTLGLTPTNGLLDKAFEYDELPAPVDELIRGLSLELSTEYKTQSQSSARLALMSKGRELLSESMEIYPVSAFEVRVPDASVDVEDWLDGVDFSRLTDILSDLMDAGMPASMLGSLSNFI